MYRAHASYLLIAAFLWSMSPAEATVLVPASFKEMVQEATVIAHGRVALVVPQWAPGRRRIESLVTIEIANTLKGVQRSAITIVTPGGELGSYRSVMVGAPVFAPGDEVVVFLKAQPPLLPRIIGLNQGVFRVVTPAGSAAKQVLAPVLTGIDAGAGKVVRGDPSRRAMSVGQFAEEVRRALDATPLQPSIGEGR